MCVTTLRRDSFILWVSFMSVHFNEQTLQNQLSLKRFIDVFQDKNPQIFPE